MTKNSRKTRPALSAPEVPEVNETPTAEAPSVGETAPTLDAPPDTLAGMIQIAVTGEPAPVNAADADAAARALDQAFDDQPPESPPFREPGGDDVGLGPEHASRGRGRPRDPNSRRSRAAARREGRDVPEALAGSESNPARMTRDSLYQRNLALEAEARARDAELAALRASANAAGVAKLADMLGFTGRVMYGAVAQIRGPHWLLSPEEQAQWGETAAEAVAPYAGVVAEYLPLVNFIGVNYAIISARLAWEQEGRPTGQPVADVPPPAVSVNAE